MSGIYLIDFYKKENGKIPVQDFLYSLEPKLRAKAFRDIELLQNLGNELKEPYVKSLKGNKNKGLYELRIKFSKADYKTNLNYKSSGWFFLCNLYKNGKTRKRCKRMNDSAFLNSRRTGIFKDMSNGTICIPKDLRDNNGLEKNDRVELIPMQEGIYIRKAYGEKKCQ